MTLRVGMGEVIIINLKDYESNVRIYKDLISDILVWSHNTIMRKLIMLISLTLLLFHMLI